MRKGGEDQTSRFLYELCSTLFAVLRSPEVAIPPSPLASEGIGSAGIHQHDSRGVRWSQASPAAMASLMLGVSMALMLGGSVTFVLGFMLMPWVLGLLTFLYLAGIVSSLSGLGRAILFPSAFSALKEVKGRLLSKLPTD